MKIVTVTSEQYERYIPLLGWGSVEAAINIYSQGFTKGSRAANTKQVQDISEDHGDFAAAFYVLASRTTGNNKLVEKLLSEAKSALGKNVRFEKRSLPMVWPAQN